ncbi:MAG: hypothetical protein EPO08_21240 [Rhodospirillaceae bacterium]|nr:MAG: hypothetical protein EPO08_21240 [Rhodospirillaceae bacterium]
MAKQDNYTELAKQTFYSFGTTFFDLKVQRSKLYNKNYVTVSKEYDFINEKAEKQHVCNSVFLTIPAAEALNVQLKDFIAKARSLSGV